MKEIIEKLDTLRKWKRNGVIKITKDFREDDFDTLLNQIELAIQALQQTGWIKVDKGNLPKKEVLAMNQKHDCLVGYLSQDNDFIICEDEHQILPSVTYYKLLTPPNE